MAANVTFHPNSTWIGTTQMWQKLVANAVNVDVHPGAIIMQLPISREERDAMVDDLMDRVADRIEDNLT